MAEKKTAAAAEAETVTEAAALPDPEELVDYTAPRLGPDRSQKIFVGVNGENIQIRRGEPVKIKRKFYEVLEAAARQERAAWEARQAAQEAGAAALANL